MTEVYIYCNPDTGKTTMKINNVSINNNNKFYNHIGNEKFDLWVKGYKKGMMVWKGLLPELVDETNDVDFSITFKGRNRDFKTLLNAVDGEKGCLMEQGIEVTVSYKHEKCDDYESYHEKIQSALEILNRQSEILKRIEAGNDLKQELNNLIKNFSGNMFKVIVLGRFKGGKSSLINAIIGEKILPAKAIPATSVVTKVKYGENPSAKVYPESGKPFEINIDELNKYCIYKDPKKYNEKSKYKEIEVFLPSKILQSGVEFIDTPGHCDITDNTLLRYYTESADLIIYNMSSVNAYGYDDKRIIDEFHKSNLKNIFFVLPYYDFIDDDDKEEFTEIMKTRLSKETELGDMGIYFVSSLAAQGEDLDKSGIIKLKKNIRGYLVNTAGKNKIDALYSKLKFINKEAEKSIYEKLKDESILAENKKIMDDFCTVIA